MLVVFCGYSFAGKDSAANRLVDKHGWVKTYYSKSLEDSLVAMNPWVVITQEEWQQTGLILRHPRLTMLSDTRALIRYADLHELVGYDVSKKVDDVRGYLQRLGTEVGREILSKRADLSEDIWPAIIRRFITEHQNLGHNVTVTGARYISDLRVVRSLGGLKVWVSRPGLGPVNAHEVANDIGPDDCDLTLVNDGTLDDLHLQVDTLTSELLSHAGS
jgi:hypothetical protein